jgi:cytidylate kinase
MKNIVIAIDGFSSTGKSTLAKQLAQHLGYIFVDSGAMYRAITYFAMKNKWVDAENLNQAALITNLKNIQLSFVYNADLGFSEMFLNNENIEKQIRTIEVSNLVSKIAAISEVRSKLVEQQQAMGISKAIVMDGRDIGTVVFPNAELKIFMNASANTRAKRRFDELIAKGDKVTFDEVLKNVESRDYIDTHRADSPLIKANDAIEIDNSDMTRTEQFTLVLDLINKI